MYKHIIITVVSLLSVQVIAAKHPSALELLDKYAETQDRLQSFIYKSKSSYESHNSLPAYKKCSGKKTEFYELRYDGNRTSARYQKWGNVGGIYFTKEDPTYISWLWDGENYIKYSTPDKGRDLGIVVIERDRNNIRNKRIISSVPDCALMGFFYGDDDRIDLVLRKADKISVRHEIDIINNSKCYVIDAIGRGGEYTIWIDPEHDYHIAKARIRRQENNLMYGKLMQQEEKQSTLMENVRFEKVGDIWVPVEADRKTDRILGRGHFDKWKLHTVRTEMILNPDHDALGSFLPDDIENGATVYIVAGISTIKYIWQNGKVVDEKGRVIMDCRPKKSTKK